MTFGPSTTTDEVLDGVDLTGTLAVITGATSGLGLETARALAAHGSAVVLAARDEGKLAGAAATLTDLVPGAAVTTQVLDLASLASVREAAATLLAAHPAIDLLINNAGVMACPLGRTADGFELQFGTNHLGHFLLTNLLLPALLAAPAPRVVSLSSAGHLESPIRWDDPNYESAEYAKWEAYGQSKTANALFALELDRRYADRGLHAFAVHPGIIITPLARHMTDDDFVWMAERAEKAKAAAEAAGRSGGETGGGGGGMSVKPVEAGAATTVWAATAPELVDHGGAYLLDCHVAEPGDSEVMSAALVAPWACDPEQAARLWELSVTLVALNG
jgi:NAD(P)-dependent dehydrogenase (short-subunit alcohol dehydrogenase family)